MCRSVYKGIHYGAILVLCLVLPCDADMQILGRRKYIAAATGDTQIVSDNFNRADSALNSGGWIAAFSETALNIVSNVVTTNNLDSDRGSIRSDSTLNNDQYAQTTIVTADGQFGDVGIGLILRASSSARTYYTVTVHDAASSNTSIGKMNAGSFTSLTIVSASPAWGPGDILYMQVVGTTITVKRGGVNGTTISSTTDATIASGFAGIRYSSTMTSASVDDWSAGNK